MNKVSIYGASGHGVVIAELITENGKELAQVIDDNPHTGFFKDVEVVKPSHDNLKAFPVIIAIGNNDIRKHIVINTAMNYAPALIHNKAVVSKSVSISKGTVVMVNATINAAATIGHHCIINTGAIVEHHCKIADFVHVAPNASLAGGVQVGEATHIGIGAVVKENVIIGKNCMIGAGTVVIENIPDNAIVVGNPGKIKSYNI